MDSFGALRAAASRSARGLMVGGGIIVAIFGALLAWNLLGRGGQRGLIGAAIVALVAIPAVVVYLKSPKRVGAYEGGLVLEPYFGRAARVAWSDVVDGRIWIAPLGKQPTIISMRAADGHAVTVSEAEYDGVGALIEVALAHVGERIRDDRG